MEDASESKESKEAIWEKLATLRNQGRPLDANEWALYLALIRQLRVERH
jgi:hypothetical protein